MSNTSSETMQKSRGGPISQSGPLKRQKAARRLQRCIQALSFVLFLFLLLLTFSPLPQTCVPVDLFLRMDPSVAAIVPLAAREWITALWPGFALMFLALAAGRLFCGYICPMGVTLDIFNYCSRHIYVKKRERSKPEGTSLLIKAKAGFGHKSMPRGLGHMKYLFLFFLLGAAFFGLNFSFWLSPIPLVTRFYALLVHPVMTLGANESLALAQPVLSGMDMPSLSYAQVLVRRFDSMYFLLLLFGCLFLLEGLRPRFWCRYICPAGAMLGIFSLRPLWRRCVYTCIECSRCSGACPSGAIHPDGRHVDHAECITCRHCIDICPVNGTLFKFEGKPSGSESGSGPAGKVGRLHAESDIRKDTVIQAGLGSQDVSASERLHYLPSRRDFILATGMGVGVAALGFTSLHSPLRDDQRGLLWSDFCVRPPGAVPEPDFLSRCVRCGQCMKVCPTNGLQPTWFASGIEGMFSPVLVSRRGPCEPDCNACGQVCPTGAISPLPLEEKHWAKIGTAVVIRGYCLAWAENRSCVVCEEVCPYGAIKCERQTRASVPVPVVKAERCFGCGYCEQHCPVRVPAIVVRPLNALRLHGAEYKYVATGMGLSLVPGSKEQPLEHYPEALTPGGLPPGFSD